MEIRRETICGVPVAWLSLHILSDSIIVPFFFLYAFIDTLQHPVPSARTSLLANASSHGPPNALPLSFFPPSLSSRRPKTTSLSSSRSPPSLPPTPVPLYPYIFLLSKEQLHLPHQRYWHWHSCLTLRLPVY